MDPPGNIIFEEGWSFMQKGVTKLIRILEGEPEPSFEFQQLIELYTTIYHMCNFPNRHEEQLYKKFREVIEDYLRQKVWPSLREKYGEYMLRELVKRWDNHKIMAKWLYKFFNYLERRFIIPRGYLPTLEEVGLECFNYMIYTEVHSRAKEAVLALIHQEREGEEIDRILVKNVIHIFVENGKGTIKKYEEDFESFMLQDTTSYYSRKVSRWIEEDSCPDYMLKSEECLKKERERVTNYLHSSTEPKLVEKLQNELLVVVAKQLLENEQSGCCALLRDDKIDDLSRMYRLYHPIPHVLEPIAHLFKQHIITEGNAFIKQANDEATNQMLIRKISELHEKYMVYVTECFQNNALFHKALEEAFEIFCNKLKQLLERNC